MSATMDFQLKKSFRTHYPDYAARLDKAGTFEEFDRMHQEIIAECKANLRRALEKADIKVSDDDYDATASLTLNPEMYASLISAKGDDIKRLLQTLMDGLDRLEQLGPDADAEYFTAQMLAATLTAVTVFAIPAFAAQMMLEAAVVAEAALAGVIAATPLVIVEVIALVVVTVLIPIIYFMMKPANCVILLLNELDEDIEFESQYNVHGKPSVITSPIPQSIVFSSGNSYINAGFVATQKRDAALYGTQYGIAYKTKNTGVKFAFGTECPLTSIYSDNNCYCAFGESAEKAANTTTDKNVQEYTVEKDGVCLSIKCNSGAGSVAYYVARIYKKA